MYFFPKALPVCTVIICLLALCLTINSCFSDVEYLSAKYPLHEVAISPIGEIEIVGSAGVNLEDLVVLKPFKQVGLWPGVTIQEAEKILGKAADRTFVEQAGRDSVYAFKLAIGELQILKQRVSSEGMEVDRWFLRLRILEDFNAVHHSILEYIPDTRSDWRIRIYAAQDDDGVAAIDIKDKKIEYLWWLA